MRQQHGIRATRVVDVLMDVDNRLARARFFERTAAATRGRGGAGSDNTAVSYKLPARKGALTGGHCLQPLLHPPATIRNAASGRKPKRIGCARGVRLRKSVVRFLRERFNRRA